MEKVKVRFAKWVDPGYEYRLRVLHHLFNKNDIKGKFILDIGAGCGETSGSFILEFGAKGATAVDAYEGHGSKIETYRQIAELKTILKDKVEVIKCDIWNFVPEKKYGFIFAISSLHHIAESKLSLRKAPDLEERVVKLFIKIGNWLNDDGKFVFFEIARRNWSPVPTYRKRYKTVVDLSTKQEPRTWISALRKAGFEKINLRYPTPVILDRFRFIHWLFNNYLMCILTNSGYLIEASNFRNYKK